MAPARAVVLDPYEDTWALVQPDADHGRGARRRCCRPPTTPCCAPASGTTCAAPSTTPRSTPPTCSTCSRPGLPVEDSDDARRSTRCPGSLGEGRRRSAADPAAALRRVHAAAARQGRVRRRPGPTLQLAALPGRDQLGRPTPASCARWLAGRVLPDGHRARPRPALADPGAARGARRDRPRRARRRARAEPTARSRVEHARATASLPDAEAKAWAWQRFTGEVDVPNYELEATGHGHVAPTARSTSPRRTSTATSPSCPAPSRRRSGWVLADAARVLLPGHRR